MAEKTADGLSAPPEIDTVTPLAALEILVRFDPVGQDPTVRVKRPRQRRFVIPVRTPSSK